MKAVMLSIQPKWCELIVSGKKTIEVRKTAPKLETPFKCYIYCTASDVHSCLMVGGLPKLIHCCNYKTAIPVGGVIGNRKVIGEFVCDKVYDITPVPYYEEETGYKIPQVVLDDSCLFAHDIITYLTRKNYRRNAYGLHVSELKIYDKPKELGEFFRSCNGCDKLGTSRCTEEISPCRAKKLTRPPQSWCYVEELNESRYFQHE